MAGHLSPIGNGVTRHMQKRNAVTTPPEMQDSSLDSSSQQPQDISEKRCTPEKVTNMTNAGLPQPYQYMPNTTRWTRVLMSFFPSPGGLPSAQEREEKPTTSSESQPATAEAPTAKLP
jgi:hypothetical protein